MEAAFDRLHLVHARLLFIISQMFEEKILNQDQKINLKCMIAHQSLIRDLIIYYR